MAIAMLLQRRGQQVEPRKIPAMLYSACHGDELAMRAVFLRRNGRPALQAQIKRLYRLRRVA